MAYRNFSGSDAKDLLFFSMHLDHVRVDDD
jgi:hypothetical protein